MIDYEKLKIAHELADKYCKENNMTLVIEANYYAGGCVNLGHTLYFGTNEIENLERCSLDKIIAKLQELTQPKPKYEEGSKVFYLIYADEVTINEPPIISNKE